MLLEPIIMGRKVWGHEIEVHHGLPREGSREKDGLRVFSVRKASVHSPAPAVLGRCVLNELGKPT